MQAIQTLSLTSQIILYVLLVLIGLYILLIGGWQIKVLRGKPMGNPDGSTDDWHEQKTHYGIAFADVFLACPAGLVGILLIFLAPRWGFYLLGLVSFWFVWANIMTTATSLRFENPKISMSWIVAFPFGIFLGIAYIIWTIVHFHIIFGL